MRRARSILTLNLLALLASTSVFAASQSVDFVNGIGLIDYAAHPQMKVGSWVKYHVTGSSQLGEKDDYEVTVLIPAEERFWGEDCFWVETWTQAKGRPPAYVATLMSYDVFTDSFPTIRSQYYMRKTVNGLTPDGSLQESVLRRPASTLKKRTAAEAPSVKLDTLGNETLALNGANFLCRKVSWQEGKSATLDQRDSSITTEVRENRMEYFCPKVPVTGLFREDIEHSIKRKSWAVGHSAEASPLNVMDIAKGSATLVSFGDSEHSRLLPADRWTTLADFDASGRRLPKGTPRSPAPAKTAAAMKKKS